MDCLYIDAGVDVESLKNTLEKVIGSVFASMNVELRWRTAKFPALEDSLELDIKIKGEWIEVAGSGMITKEMLKKMGFDPESVSGDYLYGDRQRAKINPSVILAGINPKDILNHFEDSSLLLGMDF